MLFLLGLGTWFEGMLEVDFGRDEFDGGLLSSVVYVVPDAWGHEGNLVMFDFVHCFLSGGVLEVLFEDIEIGGSFSSVVLVGFDVAEDVE